jgi:hypothetical protein
MSNESSFSFQLPLADQNAISRPLAVLEVRLLGKLEIKSDAKPVTITSRPAQSLFAYLILRVGTNPTACRINF